MNQDRRVRRSDDPNEALRLLMERLAERDALNAVVLADEKGALVARGGTMSFEAASAESEEDDVFAWQVDLSGRSLRLMSVGGRVRRVREAMGAIGRILAA